MEETTLHRNQSRAHPWGWALCGSFLAHAGVVLILSLYILAPPAIELPKTIKIDLISLPAAPMVQKRSIPQPIIQETVVTPPAQEPKQLLKKKAETAPKPAIVLNKKAEPITQQAEVPVIEFARPILTEFEPSEDLPTTTEEKIPEESPVEAGQGEAQVATTTAGDNRLEIYSNLIRERINKVKRYPLMARKAGQQGMVVVEFSIDHQGELLNSQVMNSCGTKTLDMAALKAVRKASPFAKLPEDIKSPHSFRVQINFSLDG